MTEVIEDADAEVIGKVVEESIEAGTTDVLEQIVEEADADVMGEVLK